MSAELASAAGEQPGLLVDALTIRYGGNTAVDGVTIHAPRGRVTGLMGPNGAGKTSTFNAISGLLKPSEGKVRIDGVDVTSLAPQARAQRGLGRTFQRMKLFESSTVEQNVALGLESRISGANPWRHVFSSRTERHRIREAATDAMEACGITQLATASVADITTGQRRLVELARVVAGGFDLMLLDEPSSGLDNNETAEFGTILRNLAARGIGILLVEHDMSLVMGTCEYLFVIDFGVPIFDGTPTETQASPVVQSAYLGNAA